MRVLFALLGAFVGGTSCWIVWGVLTPGDLFANGSPLLWVTLVAAVAVLGFAGLKARSKVGRGVLVVLALACGLFWIAARDGWWAKAPPGSHRHI